VKAITLNKYT